MNESEPHDDVSKRHLITWIFEEDSFAPAAKIKGDKRYSIVTDHLGTPTQGYNEEGALIWERQLDSYGKIRMLTGDEGFCNYLYQGQTLDNETGLAYNRFRYYDCSEGVYISQDPIGLLGGHRLYGYVEDPSTWIDPFGLAGTCGDNAKKLRQNLEREGRIVGPEQAAGHIVASTGSKGHWAPAVESRTLLSKYRIDINDAANGIPVNHPNPHGKMHTADYHQTVRDRLYNVESSMQQQGYGGKAIRGALRKELRAIGKEPL